MLALLVASVLTLYLVLENLDIEDYKDEIAAAVKDLTGRDLTIGGHLKWSIAWHRRFFTPVVVGYDLSLANAPWGVPEPMLHVERLEVGFDLIKLIQGDFDSEYFIAQGGWFLLELNEDGAVNWDLPVGESELDKTEDYLGGDFPYLQQGTFQNLSFRYRDPSSAGNLGGELTRLDVEVTDGGNLLSLVLDGEINRQAVVGRGTLTALRSLAIGGSSPLKLDLQLRDSKLSVAGATGQRDGDIFLEIDFNADGPKISSLAHLLTFDWPEVGDFKSEGHLLVTPEQLKLSGLQASLGDSDLAGDVSVAFDTPANLSVKLTSETLDTKPFLPDDLAPAADVLGKEEGKRFVFDNTPLPFDALPDDNSEIEVAVKQVLLRDLKFDDVQIKVTSTPDEIHVETIKLTYRGAEVNGGIKLDKKDGPALSVDLLTQNFDLGQYLADHHVTDLVTGEIDVGIKVTGKGDTPRALVSSLDGHAAVVMSEGKIASRYVDLIATDLLQLLMPWKKDLNEAQVKCALVQFEITDGVAKTQSLLFDTKNMTMKGSGTIDLTTEKIHFYLWPRPKDPALISLATGLIVSGTLLDTHVSVNPISIAVDVAEGVAGVLLLGPAGILIPFVSLGAGHHHPCIDDLQKVFGKSLSGKVPYDAGDPDTPSGKGSKPPQVVILPGSGVHIDPDQMKTYLENLGYKNVGNIEKDGAIFHADATWDGRDLRLRIDSNLDTIEYKDR